MDEVATLDLFSCISNAVNEMAMGLGAQVDEQINREGGDSEPAEVDQGQVNQLTEEREACAAIDHGQTGDALG